MPSWSSPRPSSRAEQSMPSDGTPRISPALSTRPEAGMVLPTGAKTAFMPVRALGAPQTTETGPSPASTVQARRRSALGCCAASMTWAMRKRASAAPGFSTPSSSRPMPVRVSVMVSRSALVSRCSRSQDRVNFMRGSLSEGGGGVARRDGQGSGQCVEREPAEAGMLRGLPVFRFAAELGDAIDRGDPVRVAVPVDQLDNAEE